MDLHRKLWNARVMVSLAWSESQWFFTYQSGSKGMCFGMATVTTPSNGGERRRQEVEEINFSTCRTIGDMSTVCKKERLKKAVQILDVMERQGFRAYSDTCIHLLHGFAKVKALVGVKVVHAHVIKSEFEPDTVLRNTFVSMYCKCNSIEDARQVFDKMPNRDVISWNAMIAGLAQQGHCAHAFELFQKMQLQGVESNKITFISILNACFSPVALEQGKLLHADIIKARFESDVRVGTALVSMYCKCGCVVDARRVFENLPERDVISWNAMIAGLVHQGHGAEAFKLFQQMQREGLKPNTVTYISILNTYAMSADLEQSKCLHASIIEAGFETDVRVMNALVNLYCKCGSVVDARQVFTKMPQRDVISWTAMIAGTARHGHHEEALTLFQNMQGEGIKPNKITFISILTVWSSPVVEHGKRLHAGIIKAGFESDLRVGTALVSMYCKCGNLVDARQVFDKMPERDVILWTAMISGSAEYGYGVEAFKLFEQMQQEGVKPNKVTFISILNACASLAALEEGKRVHAHIIKSGFESDLHVGNALVDMYAKCGSVRNAWKVFDKILERDVISWTAMIVAYAQHGHGKEALQQFEHMQLERVKPDNVTFVGVLTACSHMGFMDEGQHYFISMSQNHGITPSEKHYSCMVDLLGRAGHLDEAEDFIKKMPFEPDASVWGALLGACRIHGNVELAGRVAECLLKLEPQDAGVYVLLSNVYAAAGRWDAVAKVRKVMEDRGVQKQPGYSWIEINNRLHRFMVGDRSHPQTEQIYAKLDRLIRQMKEAGYVPDMRFVLHGVNQQSKEQVLCHHSEKLAIAFGLISTPPGTPVRIIKNLRVCGDCHTAMKLISKIAGREIVARDTSRFHLFRNGVCSCGDYW